MSKPSSSNTHVYICICASQNTFIVSSTNSRGGDIINSFHTEFVQAFVSGFCIAQGHLQHDLPGNAKTTDI